jgi:hypothetical protein
MTSISLTAAAAAPPAGGATLGQVVIASTAAAALTAILLYLGFGYRAGRLGWLRRLAAWSEQVGGTRPGSGSRLWSRPSRC